MNWSKLRSKNIFVALAAMATSIVFHLCTDFASVNAFEIQSESKTKEGLSRETISFNGQVRDPGWLSVKFDGSVLDLNPTRGDAFTSYGYKLFEPAALEKNSVTDTRVTLGMWDNWVRWTSRQAASNYMTPGTDLTYLRQTGLGFNNFATSQRIETGIFKTDSMRLSAFAEYAKVGTYFASPELVNKRQDVFSKANTTTTRMGATLEKGPFSVTLEQRSQQSLSQDNAPIQVQNQVGVSVSFDELLGRHNLFSIMPSSAWLNVGQGKVKAPLNLGVDGDTTSDLSVGLSWMIGKIYANVGYWQSDYRSQLYPWKGSGINGSLGFHEGLWGVDLYFDIASSATSYALSGIPQPTSQTLDATSGILFRSRF